MASDITQFNSIKDVPKELIHERSKDGKTLLLVDGTKVSDKLIADAKAKPKNKAAAAASPASPSVPELVNAIVNHPDFENAVRAIAEGAARVIFEASQKGGQ